MRVPCDVSGKWQPDVQGCCWSFLSSKWILKLIITATFWSKTAKVADALFRWTLIFYLPRWMKTLKSLAILLLQVTSYYSPLKGGILKDQVQKHVYEYHFFSNWLMVCVDSICYIRYITEESAVTAYQCYRKLCSGQCGHDYVRNGILAYYLLSTVQYILYTAFYIFIFIFTACL